MATGSDDLVDITDLQMGKISDQGVLYEALMDMCEGINSINRDTKAIRKSVDKLYNKMDDITKRLVAVERSNTAQDKEIADLKTEQKKINTEVITVKTMVDSLAEHGSAHREEFHPDVTVIATKCASYSKRGYGNDR